MSSDQRENPREDSKKEINPVRKHSGLGFFAPEPAPEPKYRMDKTIWIDNPNTMQKTAAWFFMGLAAVTAPVSLGYLTANHGDNWAAVAEKFGHGQEGVIGLSCTLAAIAILGILSFVYLCCSEDQIEIPNPALPPHYNSPETETGSERYYK